MRHRQASVLDIIKQATRELDIDQSEVINGIFDDTNAVKLRWRGLLMSASEMLLLEQVNSTVFQPLLTESCLPVTYSSYYTEVLNREVTVFNRMLPNIFPKTVTRSYATANNKEYNRTLLAQKKNAYKIPEDFLDLIKLKPYSTYKIRGNELYVDGTPKTAHLSYISNCCYVDSINLNNKLREPTKDSDICVLDKELMVKAVKYAYGKENADPTLNIKQQELQNRINYFLGKDSDYAYGNNRITFGRRW